MVTDLDSFEAHCKRGLAADAPYVIVAKIDASVRRDMDRKHSDGHEEKYIFVSA
jgi:sulfopyruvate decarboxylase subunit beta